MTLTVTLCSTDQLVGSNPLWHSCLLLSRLDETTGKMEVVETWGFYGLPSTGASDSWLEQLKTKLKLNLNLKGNHGMLRHETVRFLDLGYGLHGTTFELSEVTFKELQEKCRKMAADQDAAIKEIVEPLGLKGKSPENTRIYAHEQWAPNIFALEKARAEQARREPRLKPFELDCKLTLRGPDLNASHTCKTQAIELLDGILSPQQINLLTENGQHKAVPRYSGKEVESMALHSEGPFSKYKKASGEEAYYRDGDNPDVKLYWTVPPQKIITPSATTKALLTIPKDFCPKVKSLAYQLQTIEWLFINAKLPEHLEEYRAGIVNRIHQTYEAFAKISPKDIKDAVNYGDSWETYFRSLLFMPKNGNEKKVVEKINQAKELLNSLYMAIADDWKIDEDCPSEPSDDGNTESGIEDIYHNPLEAIASYLPVEDKKKLCNVIGRNYVATEVSSESSMSCN